MINKILDFKKLRPKEKLLLIVLTVAIGLGVYFNLIHKPLSRKIVTYRHQIERSESRVKDLQAKFPQIDKYKQKIRSLSAESDSLVASISEVEKSIPNIKNTSDLLNEVVKKAEDLKITSIRQKLEPDEEYSRIFLELKFNAPYKDTINYIRRLESISPFLVIEQLDISEPRGKREEDGTPTRLVLSSLLGKISTAEKIKTETEKEAIEVARDIFASKARPVSAVRKVDLKVEGITYSLESPTAIIDGEVIRVGSEVGNLTVKEIHPDSVILTDGMKDHILSVER